jgi:LPS-assembly lipoprotein
MSSPDRRSLILLPLALAACGFAPAYGPQGAASGLAGRIRAADPTDKNGFDLVERLEERLGRPEAPLWDLTYRIETASSGVGITPDEATLSYHLRGSVAWTLTAREGGATVASGRAESFTAWSATGSTVAGLAAEEDAALRLMRILADQIVTRLIATAGAWA